MWIILKDHSFDPEDGIASRVGVRSRNCPDQPDTKGWREFRMLDDDRNVVYSGLSSDWESENAFAPLDDFGTPDAGCTMIEYKNPNTKAWEPL